mgnify:CR=1 FL=1
MPKLKPKFCPNCGKPLRGRNAIQPFTTRITQTIIGYDTYCKACGWSGDISPDEKTEEDRGEE